MSKQFLYAFRSRITADEHNASFDTVQSTESNLVLDEGLVGIHKGMGLTEQISPSLNILVSGPGVAKDKIGQRIVIASNQNVDVSQDFLGMPTVPLVDPRIVSVFAKFIRFESDGRIDGNGQPFNFVQDEGFEFVVVRGAEAPSPVAPALDSEFILLGDINFVVSQTQVLNADFDFSRTEFTFKSTQGPVDIQVGMVTEAVDTLVTQLGNHLDGSADRHPAAAVDYAGGPDWHPDSGPDTNPAATVEVQIDKIIDDLADDINPCGAERVGARPQTVGGESVTQGSIFAQTTEILTSLDGKITSVPAVPKIFTQSVDGAQVLAGAPVFNVIGRWESTLNTDVLSMVLTGIAEGDTINSVRVRVLGSATNTCTATLISSTVDNTQVPAPPGGTSVGAGAQWLSLIVTPIVVAASSMFTIQWVNDGADITQVELRAIEYTVV